MPAVGFGGSDIIVLDQQAPPRPPARPLLPLPPTILLPV